MQIYRRADTGRMFDTVHRMYLKQSNTKQENSTNRKEGKENIITHIANINTH